jgi:hypothetical protein
MRLTRTHKSCLNPPPSAEANLSSLLLVGENEQVQAHDTWHRGPTTRGSSQAPVIAFVIVLAGIRIPSLLVHSLTPLGQAAGGVALFASGIILASGRMAISRSVVTLVALKMSSRLRLFW